MRRFAGILAVLLVFTAVLAGCGKKDAGSVVKALDRTAEKMESYQAAGTMVLHTGIDPQAYQVEVWYKKPNYYRIALTNDKKDVTQIVLRNDEGVFVLTPHLNKSFRFQSDWPDNQGQVYLFQSLVNSIVDDNERKFTMDGDAYVFDVAGNYQNASLARQKVWLSKKDYAPKHIEVSDANGNTMVVFDFTEFTFGKAFDKDSFDMQRNMTSYNMKSLPTTGQVAGQAAAGSSSASGKANAGAAQGAAVQGSTAAGGQAAAGSSSASGKATAGAAQGAAVQGNAAAGGQAAAGSGSASPKANAGAAQGAAVQGSAAGSGASAKASSPTNAAAETFGVIEPTYTPKGVQHQGISDVNLGETKGVVLRYDGTYTYTLLESRPADQAAVALKGDIVDLGYTVALLAGDQHKTMIWTYDGIEYRLSTDNLPQDDMVKIAQSVQAPIGK